MTKIRTSISLMIVALALSQAPNLAGAQGKGGGKGHGGGGGRVEQVQGQGQGRGQGKGHDNAKAETHGRGAEMRVTQRRGRSELAAERGHVRGEEARAARAVVPGPERIDRSFGPRTNMSERSRFTRAVSLNPMPPWVRTFAASNRRHDVVLAGVVAQAFARGRGNGLRIVPVGDQVRLANRRGDVLAFLDDESARDLGSWRVGVLNQGVRAGAPSFCRSGAGHPVWGRQWCIDKGFGLGTFNGLRWGRTTDVGDLSFGRGSFTNRLGETALLGLLGATAFNRLALHAVTLGLVEPLTGMWVAQPTGPRMLLVNSGPQPVAELVDVNRDNRVDRMLVALRSW